MQCGTRTLGLYAAANAKNKLERERERTCAHALNTTPIASRENGLEAAR